jgi:hypothetical protein
MNRRKSVSNFVLCKYINVNVCSYWRGNVCGIDTIQEIKLQITCKLTNVKRTVPSLQREHQSSSLLPILIFMDPCIVVWLSRNINQSQLCNRIYYSNVYWRLHMFRAAHRSSSGVLNCIWSLWFIYQGCKYSSDLLMMSGVPLKTCWVFNKVWNNKFYYKAAFCWYFYWAFFLWHARAVLFCNKHQCVAC